MRRVLKSVPVLMTIWPSRRELTARENPLTNILILKQILLVWNGRMRCFSLCKNPETYVSCWYGMDTGVNCLFDEQYNLQIGRRKPTASRNFLSGCSKSSLCYQKQNKNGGEWNKARGKIQGDGRKFLDRFNNYFGSQISSQSLNEVHIYRLQLKSATNGDFFSIYFCFWLFRVGVTECKWRTKPTKCC